MQIFHIGKSVVLLQVLCQCGNSEWPNFCNRKVAIVGSHLSLMRHIVDPWIYYSLGLDLNPGPYLDSNFFTTFLTFWRKTNLFCISSRGRERGHHSKPFSHFLFNCRILVYIEGYFGVQKRLFLPLQTANGLRLITLMAMASKMRSFYCTAM